jgi:hypothetical protein
VYRLSPLGHGHAAFVFFTTLGWNFATDFFAVCVFSLAANSPQ